MEAEGNARSRPTKETCECCLGRTTLEKVLLVTVMTLLCVIGALIAATIRLGIGANGQSSPELCGTPGCEEAANNIINAINQTVDPCVDFFQFACGQWIHDHPIPDDKSSVSTGTVLADTIGLQLKAELSSNTSSSSQSINSAQTLYATCMDVEKIDEAKTMPIKAMLTEFGGWPLLDDGEWDGSRATFNRLVADLRGLYAVEPLISMTVTADFANSSRRIIGFDAPSLVLGSRDYYLLPDYATHREAYKKAIYGIACLMLSDYELPVPANLSDAVENIVLIETMIANITPPPEQTQSIADQVKYFTIAEMYGIMPELDWLSFVSASAPPDAKDIIRNDTTVVIGALNYLEKLRSVLQTVSPRQLADMALWRAIQAYSGTQSTTFRNNFSELDELRTGITKAEERYKTCNSVATTYLPMAVGALYVREHFSADDKKEATDMISNIREAFQGIVRNLDWMDDSTKAYALEKEKNIVELIGYPAYILDPQLLDKEYEGVNISPNDSYFEQMRQLRVWQQKKDILKLRKSVDRSEFPQSPAVVNAFYDPTKNSITFNAGIMQPPYFKSTYPKFVNYGTLGSVIGHEITHGFDDIGSQFDQNGNVVNWWSNFSAANFAQRTQCMVNQYNNYTVPGTNLHANGQLTIGENIADNGGIKESYEAYRAYVQQHGEEPRLPGLQQFTPDQLFFLSFAHFYCGSNTPGANTVTTLTDTHSIGSNRVLGVLSNTPQFASAFQCASGTPYNPTSKCTVW